MKFQFNPAGTTVVAGEDRKDCVVRAFAIATGRPYAEILNGLEFINRDVRTEGINCGDPAFRDWALGMGFVWVLMDNATNFAALEHLPGPIVALGLGHAAAIVDGELHDLDDCQTLPLFGYFVRKSAVYNVLEGGQGIACKFPLNRWPLSYKDALRMRSLFTLNYSNEPIFILPCD